MTGQKLSPQEMIERVEEGQSMSGAMPSAPALALRVEPQERLAPAGCDPYRVLSLFAGIGGFDLGLERTGGFRTVAFCEIDPFCQRVLHKHWPEVPIYGDVRELTADRLAADGIAVDVICGGFPCQDISLNGRRAGLAGARSGLWAEFARLIGELRPAYVIVENVAALLGDGLGRVLADLAALGFDAEWHAISAAAIGAPHERDRTWIVAHPKGEHGLYESDAWQAAPRLFADANHWKAHPWDEAAPKLCRMDDGLPDRVERTSALGNAVVPQIPELIGRAILAQSRPAPAQAVEPASAVSPLRASVAIAENGL